MDDDFPRGATFRFVEPTLHDNHLWIVLSDSALDAKIVVAVNVTSATGDKAVDRACMLRRGVHRAITHNSFINYRQALRYTLNTWLELIGRGWIQFDEPCGADLIAMVTQGAARSEDIRPGVLDVLRAQGWVPGQAGA